jgi:hypothetical protein
MRRKETKVIIKSYMDPVLWPKIGFSKGAEVMYVDTETVGYSGNIVPSKFLQEIGGNAKWFVMNSVEELVERGIVEIAENQVKELGQW